jgi:hypothetical protein
LAGKRGDYVYETDEGRLYAILCDRSNAFIQGLGLEPYGDQEDPLTPNQYLTRQPVGLRLRTVLAFNAETGSRRFLICGNTTCDVWTGITRKVDLVDYNSLETKSYTILKRIAERQFSEPKPDI